MSSVVAQSNDVANSSLDPQQAKSLEQAIAGFSTEQLIWSSGYLAGLAVKHNVNPRSTAAQIQKADTQLSVMYGSQTGNGRELAIALQQSAMANGIPSRLIDMADYTPRDIAKEKWIALVVSTHGEGEAPDDAELLLEYLQSSRAPKLNELSYSVLALGDSSYSQFCQTGRDFDAQLEKLGATRLMDRVDCDLDYEKPASEWGDRTLDIVNKAFGEDGAIAAPVPLQVVTNAPKYDKQNPFPATVLQNQRITGSGSSKTVHHLELDLLDSGLQYQPGDSLGVITPNPKALVSEFFQVLDVSEATKITLGDEVLSLLEALSSRLEITTASSAFLEQYITISQSEELASSLRNIELKRELLDSYQIIDVLHQWPIVKTEGAIQALVDALRPLVPRVYSISSSPLATPDEVHLTVAQVAYQKFNRPHWGSASTALTKTLSEGQELCVYVEQNSRFRLPQDANADVIMIGPGTGVAPFRSFVEHRASTQANGRSWLFFGDRSFDEDFLYQIEWQKHLAKGHLHRLDTAFSRDQVEKIYVQDRLKEQGKELFDWIHKGAHIYVCGDAIAMAPDVNQALIEIIAEHGQCSMDDATSYLKTLKRKQRYLRDVY